MKTCNHYEFNYEGCENEECGLEISDCMMDLTQKVEALTKVAREAISVIPTSMTKSRLSRKLYETLEKE